MSTPKLNEVHAELYRPFDNAAIGFLIVKNIVERILGDHSHVIRLKIVAELSGHNQDCLQELLDLWILSLRLVQDFTDKINRAMNLVHMSSLFSFDDNGRADNTGSCCNINQ